MLTAGAGRIPVECSCGNSYTTHSTVATQEVTGRTQDGLSDLREEHESYDRDTEFEEQYCLAKISNQPEDYTGPVRFCTLQTVHEIGDNYLCKHHGGFGSTDTLEKLAHMKHGMHATREHLIEDFTEKDEALYDWILEEWPAAYGIDLEEDPNAAYDFHRLAAEIVRGERGRGYLLEEGEVREQDRVTDEGNVVIDESGDVVTEKSEHYLAKLMHRQDNKITNLEKELGISRKERLKRDSTDDAVEAIKGFAELGSAFLSSGENDFNPDETPWDSEDSENAG